MNKRVSRQTKVNKAPMFVLLSMIFILIVIIAMSFSFFIADDIKPKDDSVNLVSNSASSNIASSDVSSASENSSSEQTSSEPQEQYKTVETVVPLSEKVEKSYFDDAVFVGDSISKGLKIYGVLPANNVLADQNVGIDQIKNDKPVYIFPDGTKKTLFEGLKAMKVVKNKIYVLLGSNGLPHYQNQQHIEFYSQVVDRLKKEYPNAMIYLQSVTPITKQAEADYKKRGKDFTNKKINEFNEMVKKMAEEKSVYYLNVRDAVVDKDGYLSSDFLSPKGDGVHFLKSGHEALYKYYKTHAVLEDGTVKLPVESEKGDSTT